MPARFKLEDVLFRDTLHVIWIFPLLCSGCTAVTSDRLTWIWFLVPLLGFWLPGWALILFRRRAQIAAWDLRLSPKEPSVRGIVLWAVGVAGSAAAAFSAYNLLLEMDYAQKGYNIGLWWLGTILGTSLALFLGLRLAEPRTLPDTGRS
jgi:hypothetical protein